MTLWQRWLRRPQNVWPRKAAFQVHLWTGIAVSLYVLMISGSVLVFRNELYNGLWPRPKTVKISGPRLTRDEIKAAARRAYPNYSVNWIGESKQPNQATEIWMDRGSSRKERLFDPFTGQDLGESRPCSIQFLRCVGDLHINLLAGAVGLWTLAVVFMFGVVGVYAAFPTPFQVVVNRIAPLDFYRLEPESMVQPAPGVTFLPVAQTGTARPRFRPRAQHR